MDWIAQHLTPIRPSLLAQIDRTTVERRFEFAALPHGWWAVAAIAMAALICWAIVWMYRTEGRRGATMKTRMLLAGLRCVIIVTLASILLQPVLATYLHRWIDSYCIVLVDDSSSMDLRDRYRIKEDAERVRETLTRQGASAEGPIRRSDVAAAILDGEDGLLKRLAARNRVKVYAFSEVPELVATLRAEHEEEPETHESDSPDALVPASALTGLQNLLLAQGAGTNVSRAIRRSTESLGGAPLAGIVLLSDGGFNRGDPVEVLARYVEDQRIPLHAVGVGDPSPVRNVRVTELVAPENAFKNDPISITVRLSAQGMEGETVTVELYERGASGGAPADRRQAAIRANGTVEPVVFNRTRESVGRAVYRVVVPPQPDESVTDDNTQQTTVNVIDDKMRVLLIAGAPSWEYRYLSRLLMRDQTFDVSCWLQSADVDAVRDGNTIIDRLPETAKDLLEYDALVLLDPNPNEFGPGWARSVEALVAEHGGGLIYIASRLHTTQFMRDPAVHRLVQLLPVTPDAEAELILNRVGHFQTKDWPIQIPKEAMGHPILEQKSAGDSGAGGGNIWNDLPGVYWHYPVLREKSVATVLMRHGNPQMNNAYGSHVLLATQFVGAGRTEFVAFDGTWRWRRFGESIYNRFWVQSLRYVVEGKLLGAKKRATLHTEGDTFQLGSVINVTARLFDPRFEPLELDQINATYEIEGRKQEFLLKRLTDRPGWYEGRFTPNRTGAYEIALTLHASGGSDPVNATQQLQVVRPNIEIINPQMDRVALQSLADRSADGGYYEIDQTAELADAIPDKHEVTTVKSRPEPLWDRWWALAGLIGMLSIEWAVRKWVRLL